MAGNSFTVQKGINPFLFEPEEPPQHQHYVYEQAPVSNPFLMDYSAPVEQSYVPENPFLSHSMGSVAPQPIYRNPFADVDQPPMNTGDTWAQDNYAHAVSTATSAQQYTTRGSLGEVVPMSTKDLLDTVTGALDATSDSLLDRLRVSQPSPIPQPPSPTPSPRTPSPVTPDLLGGFDDEGPIPKSMPVQETLAPAPVVAPEPTTLTRKPSVDIMDLYQKGTIPTTVAPPATQESVSEVSVGPAAVSGAYESPVDLSSAAMETLPAKEEQRPQAVQQPVEVAAPVPVATEILSPPERPKPPALVERKQPPTPTPSRPPPPAVVRPPPPVFSVASESPRVPNDIKTGLQAPEVVPPAPPVINREPPVEYEEPAAQAAFKPVMKYEEPPTVFKPVLPAKSRLQASTFDSFDKHFDTIGDTPAAADRGGQGDAWGGEASSLGESGGLGFDTDDSFLSITEPPPVPQSTPAKHQYDDREDREDRDDRDDTTMSVFIRPKDEYGSSFGVTAPALAPPPKSPAISTGSAFSEDSHPFVPFLSAGRERDETLEIRVDSSQAAPRRDSQDSPMTPLFEEDTSQPLEDFPRVVCENTSWEMFMRHPNKKKITGQRFWKKVFVRLVVHNDVPILQISNNKTDKDPFQEIPLQPCYSVSDIAAQQFDQYGKIFTVKLQYIFYKERAGIRPGQISKAERISSKLSQFAAFAIQGDYQGVKEFGSDLKKLGLPVEHAPQISQLVKLGTQNFEEMKQFSMCIEEALFKLPVHRDRALTYKTEEIQVTLVDEYYVEQDIFGVVLRQIARVRLFLLSFLSGNAEIELGINDMRRQGLEVVGRHDIIPIATEEWIRTEAIEFATCVQLDEFERTKMVKFKPPDACYIELLRFRVRPPKHRELPLQVKTVFTTTGHRIEIRCDILVPGFTSRKLGQIPCEDVMVRIPIPESWIYMFRVEKHFRYGSVKSAHRRSGKVKGIERFLGAVEAVENSLMEVTSGQAKYEHQHRAIVWRVSRLPKDGQGAYTTHSFFCHVTLQPHEEIPDNLTKFCYVEFTMPHTTISHTVCRSISVPMCDEPPEKCVRYLSRHEYLVAVEHTTGVAPASYSLAAAVPVPEPTQQKEKVDFVSAEVEEKKESDSDFSD